MENGYYLLAAFTAVWAGVFAYLLFLSGRQVRLHQKINAIKQVLKEKESK
jgi:CcmD family protein|tara:strand:+ start:539 stop:688 length:150 start_codon:yes stop_codon:yes gene_type:complete